ncbi:hypothetical protein Q8W71_27190 [Methylobacterium sp. NEAU 140]|uniref:hypothetical protein n=1 Tax=Methylobacterium sp. NEAU 140 TaxID=3064945 RepID=UPI0027335E40|nr:hypothetical protein [Methylobacterium sp. NEAU 140]MDP4026313.1 hypothetical protein [Methylobacterium sp. NEAU 140]
MAAIHLIDGTGDARLPLKPKVGAPCNGCGLCCAAEPCGIAREFIGAGVEGPCPAMEFGEGRFWCGMVRRPGHYLGLPHAWADETIGATIAGMLGTGQGCDADDA